MKMIVIVENSSCGQLLAYWGSQHDGTPQSTTNYILVVRDFQLRMLVDRIF